MPHKSISGNATGAQRVSDRNKADRPPPDKIPTPMWVIDEMIDASRNSGIGFENIISVLDPCCGDNRMLKRFAEKEGKYDPDGYQYLAIEREHEPERFHHCHVIQADFLQWKPPYKTIDLALVNPPFSDLGAWRFAKHLVDNCLDSTWGRAIMIIPFYTLMMSEKRYSWWNEHIQGMWQLPRSTFERYTGSKVDAYICDIRPRKTATNIGFLSNTEQLELKDG